MLQSVRESEILHIAMYLLCLEYRIVFVETAKNRDSAGEFIVACP